MKLTMQSIIRWEQLNNIPFSDLEYDNEQHVVSMFYVCQSYKDKTLIEFKESLSDDDLKTMIADFETEIAIQAQFQPKATPKLNEGEVQSDEAPMMSDTISQLVMAGLDASFVLHEMELCDLPVYIKAYDTKTKNDLTTQRLWAFIQLIPHLEKGTEPQDICPFPWEKTNTTTSNVEVSDETLARIGEMLRNAQNKN